MEEIIKEKLSSIISSNKSGNEKRDEILQLISDNYEPKKKCCGGICENCNNEEK
jgi:hypothetical protein